MKILGADGKPLAPVLKWAEREVMIATPAYDGTTNVGFTRSLVDTVLWAASKQIACVWNVQPGCPYLPVARNKLVMDFLRSKAGDLVFIDADVSWKPAAFERLLHWDADVVGGAYPLKRGDESYPVKFAVDDKGLLLQDSDTSLLECIYIPTGFMRIRRAAITRMIEAMGAGELTVIEHEKTSGRETGRYYDLFDTVKRGTQWLGEDVEFCRRWREECGGKVLLDPEMTFGHTGLKQWNGNLGNFLREQMAEQQRAAQAQAKGAAD